MDQHFTNLVNFPPSSLRLINCLWKHAQTDNLKTYCHQHLSVSAALNSTVIRCQKSPKASRFLL